MNSAIENFTYDLDVLRSNPCSENDPWRIWRSRTPKVFCLMTRTTTLALQRVDFGRDDALALSLSLFGSGRRQSIGNLNPYL